MSNNSIILSAVSELANMAAGQAGYGGNYGGKINIDGNLYALFVSPAAGIKSGLDFKTANTTDGAAAQSTYNGWAICQALNDAAHPLIQWARSQTINGKNDWYIPSRDELELIWRTLSSDAIGSDAKGLLSPQGQLGDPASGVYCGYNSHSVPTNPGNNTLARTPLAGSPVSFAGALSVYSSCTEVTASVGDRWSMFVNNNSYSGAAAKQTNFNKYGYAANGQVGTRLIRRELIGPA